MNLALLTSVAGNGGSASTAFQTTRLLARAGHQAALFAPGAYWAERGRRENVPVHSFLELRRGLHALSFWRDFRGFRRYLAEQAVDAVLVQKSPEQWLAHFAIRSLRRPIALVRLRGVVFPIRPSLFNRRLHNRMELIVCSASVIAQQYAQLPGFETAHVKVLLEGVDTLGFTPATLEQKAAARARWKLHPEALLIGTAGRPASVKGHDLLLRAFAKAWEACEPLRKRNGGARLCIFSDESRRGPGSYASLQDLSRELGLQDRVDLRPGFVTEMREVYHALDVYVLPSRGSEGSSRAGLEACAAGLPLLASAVGVLPDLVLDRVTGQLVPPDDAATLAQALIQLAVHWPAAKEWGVAARRRMQEHFREETYAEKLAQLLAEAVAGK